MTLFVWILLTVLSTGVLIDLDRGAHKPGQPEPNWEPTYFWPGFSLYTGQNWTLNLCRFKIRAGIEFSGRELEAWPDLTKIHNSIKKKDIY